jgi:hypothetical protein
VAIGPGNAGAAGLQRLAQRLQGEAAELRHYVANAPWHALG